MNEEQEWDIAITKIIKAISDLKMANNNEEKIKMSIQYVILKMTETEEIFDNNLRILDRYSENGFSKIKKK